jgi:hypothetical protein
MLAEIRQYIIKYCVGSAVVLNPQKSSVQRCACGVIEPTSGPHSHGQVICVRQADDQSLERFMARLPAITVTVRGFGHDMFGVKVSGLSALSIKSEH